VDSALFPGLKFQLEGLDFKADVGGVKRARQARDIETSAVMHASEKGANRPSFPAEEM
jgi:hypothetical protein